MCVNYEKVEKLLDFDLSDAEVESILTHLEVCNECSEKVMALAESEKRLMDDIMLRVFKKSVLTGKKDCCINNKLLLGYAIGALEDDAMNAVEGHLKQCDTCFQKMLVIQSNQLRSEDLKIEKELFTSVHGKISLEGNLIISIFEDVKRGVFEVIRCTGTLLESRPIETARGESKSLLSKAIQVRKDFEDKGVSAQVTIEKGKKQGVCDMKLSLMRLKGGKITKPIDSEKVHLKGEDVSKDAVTDKKGEAEFKGLPYGFCRVVIERGVVIDFTLAEKYTDG